jgi:DNA-binding transcriptional LysR family regulator
MRAFARVVDLGGFAAAARQLNLSPAMITKHVAYLERRTGVRLLHRTTRVVRPTDVGRAYYERCVELLAGIEDAERAAGAALSQPQGVLRITVPVEFGNAHFAGMVAEFMVQYPDITVELDFTNRVVNLIEEGFDLAVRIAKSLDSGLYGRKIATSHFHAVASPRFLKDHGRLASPAALAKCDCLCFAIPHPWDEWSFVKNGRTTQVKVKRRLLSSSSEALRFAACHDLGVALLPSFVCGADLRSGTLVSLLPDYERGSLGIFVLYPQKRALSAKLRVFLEFLATRMGSDPERDLWAPK